MKAIVYSIFLVVLASMGLFATGCDSLKGTDGTKGPSGPEGPSGLPCPAGTQCIDGAWILNGTVANASLGIGSIGTNNIFDNSVTNSKIGPGAVTSDKIVSVDTTQVQLLTGPQLAFNLYSAYGDLGNEGYLDNSNGFDLLTRDQSDLRYIQHGLIGSADLETKAGPNGGAVATTNIRTGAVTSAEIQDLTIDNVDIKNGTITQAKLAFSVGSGPGSVTTVEILDGTIQHADLDTGVNAPVDWNNIMNDAVRTAQIQNSAVTTPKIANNAVTSAKIADDTITSADLQDNAGLNLGAVATIDIQTGAVTDAKINDVAASKITGSITNAQITSLDGAKITGTVAAANIDPLMATDAELAAGLAGKSNTGHTHSGSDITSGTVNGAYIGAGIDGANITNLTITAAKIGHNEIIDGSSVRGSNGNIPVAASFSAIVVTTSVTSRGGLHLISYSGTFSATSAVATDIAVFDVVVTIGGNEVMRRPLQYNSLINGGFRDQVEVQWMGVLAAGAHTVNVTLAVAATSSVSVVCEGYPAGPDLPKRGFLSDIEFNNE